MKHKLNPLQQFVFFLVIYSIGALIFNWNQQVIIHLFATLGCAMACFFLFTKLSGKKKMLLNTIATALILFLILDPGTEYTGAIYALAVTVVAITYKFFFEYKGKPIINPVVFALLLIAGALPLFSSFELFVSWWGASYQEPLALLLLGVWMLCGIARWRKWYLLTAFLVVVAAYVFTYHGVDFFKFVFATGTIYFLASIMLIEPKSSPIQKKHQIICGVAAGLLYAVLMHCQVNYYGLISIAGMNVLSFVLVHGRLRPIAVK